MHQADDELAHVFARELESAERDRRRRLLAVGAVLAALGLVVVVLSIALGLSASGERTKGGARAGQEPGAFATSDTSNAADTTQRVSIAIGEVGYEPSAPTVKAGRPVELTVAQGEGCAAGFLMPELGVEADNSAGPAKVQLGPLDAGTYRFTCAMEMVEGRLIVE